MRDRSEGPLLTMYCRGINAPTIQIQTDPNCLCSEINQPLLLRINVHVRTD